MAFWKTIPRFVWQRTRFHHAQNTCLNPFEHRGLLELVKTVCLFVSLCYDSFINNRSGHLIKILTSTLIDFVFVKWLPS
jgi:hypothetical protein